MKKEVKILSRRSFKYRRMPVCRKFDGASLMEQKSKVIEEFYEWMQSYADCCRKADKNVLSREDFVHLLDETFDLSQAAQQFIHIATKNHGGHYVITEDDVYNSGFKKNNDRGYYDEEPVKSPYSGYIKYIYEKVD